MTEVTQSLGNKMPSPPTVSRQAAYVKAASHVMEAFETILELMKTSKNDNVRLGAANKIIDKVVPDLKSTELMGELNADGSRPQIGLFINLGSGFIPANLRPLTSSAGSLTEQPQEIQDISVASQGTQDHNSDLRGSEAGTQ